MIVTTTELQNNFGKYIAIMQNEKIIFTKNGKVIGKMIAVKENKKAAFENLEILRSGLRDVSEDEKYSGRDEKFNG